MEDEFITRIATNFIAYKKWDQEQRTHTKTLYKLLAEAKSFVEAVWANNDDGNINSLLRKAKIPYNKKTSLELKIAKISLTKDCQLAFCYAKVLIAAAKASIEHGGLVDWIYEQGGIEKIRLITDGPDRAIGKFEKGKNEVLNAVLLECFYYPVVGGSKNDPVVLLGRLNDGATQIEIVKVASVGDDEPLVRAALCSLAASTTSGSEGDAKRKDQKLDQSDAVKQLLASINSVDEQKAVDA